MGKVASFSWVHQSTRICFRFLRYFYTWCGGGASCDMVTVVAVAVVMKYLVMRSYYGCGGDDICVDIFIVVIMYGVDGGGGGVDDGGGDCGTEYRVQSTEFVYFCDLIQHKIYSSRQCTK